MLLLDVAPCKIGTSVNSHVFVIAKKREREREK